jgi:hypothetical protein
MAADLSVSEAVASAMCNALVDSIDTGGAGTLKIYGDTRAATTDTAVGAQTLLATLTFNATAFGAASAGVATANAITQDSSADDTDTATWFRISSGTPAAIADGNVGTATADLILNTVSIVSGAVVSISAGTITVPLT